MSKLEKHPPGLFVLFLTEMWERFGFYSMGAMFVLYLRDRAQGFGWSADDAVKLNSTYVMFVYASPLVGGWLANWKLGYRNSVLIGGLVFMVGYLLFTIHAEAAMYAALVCLVIGNGFFKPNVSAMVGELYPEGSPLKDRAFNIFYMGINIGALLAPINAEILVHSIGYHAAFAVAAAGMIVAVATLWTFRRYVGGGAPHAAPPPDAPTAAPTAPRPIDAVSDTRRIVALIVIFLMVIVFFLVFYQTGSTVTFFADENIHWNVSGIISNAINPFFVVVLTFPVIWMWKWLNPRGLEPSIPMKMVFGMVLAAAAFGVLYLAAKSGEASEVRPDMYPSGSFIINDRCLDKLKADGVPQEVLDKIQKKGADDKFLIKDKKYTNATTFEAAFESIQDDLRVQGVPPKDLAAFQDVKIDEGELGGDKSFTAALDKAIADLRAKGLPEDVAAKMETDKDKGKQFFTAQEKLLRDVQTVAGSEAAEKDGPAILKLSYLFKVSPVWLILAYAILTLGELMLSPMGLALVATVAPARLRGVMMGGWFLSISLGGFGSRIGVFYSRWEQSTFFAVLGLMALVIGGGLVLLLRPLKKAMPGV